MFVFQISVPALPASEKKGMVMFKADAFLATMTQIAGHSGYWAKQKYPPEVAQAAFEVYQMASEYLPQGSWKAEPVAKGKLDDLRNRLDIKFGAKTARVTIEGKEKVTSVRDFFKSFIDAGIEPAKTLPEKKAAPPKGKKTKPGILPGTFKADLQGGESGFFQGKA